MVLLQHQTIQPHTGMGHAINHGKGNTYNRNNGICPQLFGYHALDLVSYIDINESRKKTIVLAFVTYFTALLGPIPDKIQRETLMI